ncbi:DnaJ sub C member 24 [Dimargaris xerosporica]|nr:DnaJ sub C member 24 [Dimargaris xerosporica]
MVEHLTHYQYLQVAPTAPYDSIKRAYQQRILETHPDKHSQRVAKRSTSPSAKDPTTEPHADLFNKVRLAWHILQSADRRKAYDAYLRDLEARSHGIIHDEVDLDEMDFDSDAGEYLYPCRCGGDYALSLQDLALGADVAQCTTCSLRVVVDYQMELDDL